jgi:predicted Zn-dependent protease
LRALPENLVAQAALGYISLKLGNKDQATQILARAARTPGTAPEIDYFLASLLETAGEPQQAKLVIQGALKHDGLFLYRSPANQLLKRLNKGFESLPTP